MRKEVWNSVSSHLKCLRISHIGYKLGKSDKLPVKDLWKERERLYNLSGFASVRGVCLRRLWIIEWEPSLKIELCSNWLAKLEKNKCLSIARAFGDRRLGRAVSGATSRSEAMGSMPTRDLPPWLRGLIVSPSKVGITQRLISGKKYTRNLDVLLPCCFNTQTCL